MIKARPKLTKQLTAEQAVVRLETVCARAEHCSREARDKLWQWGFSTTEADKIVAGLEKCGFIDDNRYAAAYINDKVKFARWGRLKIRAMLASKHIEARIIDKAMEQIHDNEYLDNLTDLISRKATTLTVTDPYDRRARLMRFAMTRGYEPDIASSVIDNITE